MILGSFPDMTAMTLHIILRNKFAPRCGASKNENPGSLRDVRPLE
jgi:hypothetical protein